MAVRDTSAEVYRSEAFQAMACTDCALIEQLVQRRGAMTRRQIAEVLSMPTASVSGRVNELVRAGRLWEQDEKRPCPVTGKRVLWLEHIDHRMGQLEMFAA